MLKDEIKGRILSAIICIILGLIIGYSTAYGQLGSRVSELSSEKDRLVIQYKNYLTNITRAYLSC